MGGLVKSSSDIRKERLEADRLADERRQKLERDRLEAEAKQKQEDSRLRDENNKRSAKFQADRNARKRMFLNASLNASQSKLQDDEELGKKTKLGDK